MRKIVDYVSIALAFGLATSQALAGDMQPQSAFDAFVQQVGIDITAIPPEVRTEWVNSSRAASLPHDLFCPMHRGGGEVRADNASAAGDHSHPHTHSPTSVRLE